MKQRFILPLLAALGVVIAIVVIIENSRKTPERPLVIQPSQSPFTSSITGVGLVESSSGNISIGTPVSGIVREIYVKVGDHVKAGDPLFKIDDRELHAMQLTATAKVKEAEALLQKPRHNLKYLQQLKQRDSSAVSQHDLTNLRDELARAEASLELAKAQLSEVEIDIERRTIRAPMAGQVLQLHIRLGEYQEGGSKSEPLLLLGGNNKLHVRIDIDETESWRLKRGAEAVAFIRGNSELRIPLHFEYLEPYVIPKTSLTGQSTERTDVRVLQVVYSFAHKELPVFIGQQLDVFINTASTSQSNIEESR